MPSSKGPELIIGIPKSKGKPGLDLEEGSPDEEALESPEKEKEEGDDLDMHIDAMFDALQSGDRNAFREAYKKCQTMGDEDAMAGQDDYGE